MRERNLTPQAGSNRAGKSDKFRGVLLNAFEEADPLEVRDG